MAARKLLLTYHTVRCLEMIPFVKSKTWKQSLGKDCWKAKIQARNLQMFVLKVDKSELKAAIKVLESENESLKSTFSNRLTTLL